MEGKGEDESINYNNNAKYFHIGNHQQKDNMG